MRNLHPVTLSPPRINILYGDNGSGRTSVLEAIHLLGLARSFRSARLQPVIQYEEAACTVFGQVMLANSIASNLGISVNARASSPFHRWAERPKCGSISGNTSTAADQPDGFRFARGAPKIRRQFLGGSVPRGTSVSARLAAPAKALRQRELLAPAW